MSEDTRHVQQISLQDHDVRTEDGYRVYSIACNAHNSLDDLRASSHSLIIPVDEAGQVSDALKGVVRIYADCAHIDECGTRFSMIPDFHDPSESATAFEEYGTRNDTLKRQSLPSDWRFWPRAQSTSPNVTWFAEAKDGPVDFDLLDDGAPNDRLFWQLDAAVRKDNEDEGDEDVAHPTHCSLLIPVTSNLVDGNDLLVDGTSEQIFEEAYKQLQRWNSATSPVDGDQPLELPTNALEDVPDNIDVGDNMDFARSFRTPEGGRTTKVHDTFLTRAVAGTRKHVGSLFRSGTKSASIDKSTTSAPLSRVTSKDAADDDMALSQEIMSGSWRKDEDTS